MLIDHIDALILELKTNYKELGKALIDAATRNGYRDMPGSNPIKNNTTSTSTSQSVSNTDEKKVPQKNIPTVDPKLSVDNKAKSDPAQEPEKNDTSK